MRNSTRVPGALFDALCILKQSKPKDRITISELINTAGVSRSSFYYYFEDIDDVFFQMANDFCEKYQKLAFLLLNHKAYTNIEKLLSAEKELCDIVFKYQDCVSFFLMEQNYFQFREIFFMSFRQNSRQMRMFTVSPSQVRTEITNMVVYEYTLHNCCTQLLSTIELWANRNFKESPEDFLHIYEQTCGHAIAFDGY